MSAIAADREAMSDLVAQLLVEYAGALPPATLCALVSRADGLVPLRAPYGVRMATVEAVARRMLTDQLAVVMSHSDNRAQADAPRPTEGRAEVVQQRLRALR